MKKNTRKPLFITILIVLVVVVGTMIYNRNYRLANISNEMQAPLNTSTAYNISPSPSDTIVTTIVPTATVVPSRTPKSTLTLSGNPSVRLESVTPSSVKDGDSIVLKGEGFGPNPGMVVLYNASGQSSGGMTADSWSNTEIRTRMSWVSSGTFYISVKTSTFWESNKLPLTVATGQPHIRTINERTYAPFDLKRNSQVTITGTEFGFSQGAIDLIKGGDTTNPHINSWSSNTIVFTLPATLVNTEYELWLKTADGRKTSLWYVNVVD